VAGFDSAAVRGFYQRTYRPDRTTIVVTGDVTLAEARDFLTRRVGAWRPVPGQPAAPPAVSNPSSRPAKVYLVDKPGAAQSVIMIGTPGVDRHDPDYFPIEVMNTILGGSFSSRLNTVLRETKGYTYGARSGFSYRPLPGPFVASSAVRTDVTDSSLVEFFREFREIRERPVAEAELERAKAYVALSLAGDFETTSQVATQMENLLAFGLPFDYFDGYVAKVMAVTAADVQRVAQRVIRPDQFAIVIVGDVAKIRAGVEKLALGPVEVIAAP
jgi:zinc protease